MAAGLLPSTLRRVTSLLPPPAPTRIAVPLFSDTRRIVDDDSPRSNLYAGVSVPMPILPAEVIRNFSVGDDPPSAVTLKARAVGLSSVPWSPSASARISAHC